MTYIPTCIDGGSAFISTETWGGTREGWGGLKEVKPGY